LIEYLHLKNFKSHVDTEVKFKPGLNIFLGEVGAGKTSILEAISYALFSKYAGSVTQVEMIRRGAEKAEVKLIFSKGSKRYKVERTIYPEKTQKASFWVFDRDSWKLAVEGVKSVSRSIEELLDADSSTFLTAIYASQGEIKEMLETQPGKRRERLDKLLGIDMYEKMWTNFGEAKSIILNELTIAQEKASGFNLLERQLKELKNRLEKNKAEYETLNDFSKEIEDRIKPKELKIKDYEDLNQKMFKIENQIEIKNNEITNSSTLIDTLKGKIEKALEAEINFKENYSYIQLEKELEIKKRRIEIAIQRKENFEELLKRDISEYQEAENRLIKIENQLKKIKIFEKALENLKKKMRCLPELEKKQNKKKEKLDNFKTKATTILNEIENQKKIVDRIYEIGKCPTCFQIVPENYKKRIIIDANETVNKLKTEYEFQKNDMERIQKQLKETKKKIESTLEAEREFTKISVQIRTLESRRAEFEEIKSRIKKIKSNIKVTKERITSIKESSETLTEVIAKLMNVSLNATIAKEAEKQMLAKKDFEAMLQQEQRTKKTLKLQLNEVQSMKSDITKEYDTEKHKILEDNLRILNEDLHKTREGIERLKININEYSVKINQAESELKEKKKSWKQTQTLKSENRILDILRKSIREVIQPFTRKNNVLNVSRSFQDFYQELSNDNIDFASLDEEGNIEIIRNGEPSVVNSLSGGETTCAALALRLSICSSLTKNQLLLLDEPTIHLDEPYRVKLRDFLGNHNFEQLIVVTHDSTFDSLPAHIFKVNKNKGESLILPFKHGESV
jgi:exonuclease SbcC